MIAAPAPQPLVNAAFAHVQIVKFFDLAVRKGVARKGWKVGPCHNGPGKGIAGCKFTYRQVGSAGLTCTGDLLFRVHQGQVQSRVLNYLCG